MKKTSKLIFLSMIFLVFLFCPSFVKCQMESMWAPPDLPTFDFYYWPFISQLTENNAFDGNPAISGDGTKIAYESNVTGTFEICVVNSNGTLTQLTTKTSSAPSISADGSKIAYMSWDGGDSEIFVVNSDGTGLTQLTHNTEQDYTPSISGDGSKIAFQSYMDGYSEIFVVNSDGTGLTQLTHNTAFDMNPSINYDGTKIAFGSNMDGARKIFVVNSDGTGLTRLNTNNANEGHPSISGDGTKIAYRSIMSLDDDYEIFVVNSDGTELTQITENTADDGVPSISADGSKITFSSDVDGDDEVFVVNSDGSGLTQITTNTASDYASSITSDGSKIAYYSDVDGDFEIFVTTLDASGPSGSVLINGGEQTTDSLDVTLTIEAYDPESGVAEMRFANADGEIWSEWEPYSTSKLWTLPSGDGDKIISYQFMNGHGFQGMIYSSMISVQTVVEWDLTISLDGTGSTNPAPGLYFAEDGSVVDVQAVLTNSSWELSHWLLDGVDVGSSNPYNLTMNSNHELTAVFVPVGSPVDTLYTFDVQVQGSGSTYPPVGLYEDIEGTIVVVDAIAQENWTFNHWLLDGNNAGNDESFSFTLDNNHSLVAVFVSSESQGLVIHDPLVNPDAPSPDNDVKIDFVIDAENGVELMTLIYSVDGADWQTIPMSFDGDSWIASIPKQDAGKVVTFYAACSDFASNYAESENYAYEIIQQGLAWWIPPAIIIPGALGGGGLLLWQLGKLPHLGKKIPPKHVGKQDLKAETEESEDKRKRRKQKKKTKLDWNFNSPNTVRVGGSAYAFGKVINVGKVKAENVQIKIKGSDELKSIKALSLGNLEKGESKEVRVKLECKNGVSEKKESIVYILEGKNVDPQTMVRSISFRLLNVGLVVDRHYLEYLKKQEIVDSSAKVSSWLKSNNFSFGVVSDLEKSHLLNSFDVLLVSRQYALSDEAIASLKNFVKEGRGLVALDAVGMVDFDSYLKGESKFEGSNRIFDLFGYNKAAVERIERGLKGIRFVQEGHPITKLYKKGSMLRLSVQAGFAFTEDVGLNAKVLLDQRVAFRGVSGFVGVSAVAAAVFGVGRVVHFNFDTERVLSEVSLLVEQALLWAGKLE